MKILTISDSPLCTTGYGHVMKKINQIFISSGCEVRQIAWGLHEEIDYEYKLYPTPKNDFGKSIFTQVLEDFLPDVVFSYGDLLNIGWISQYPRDKKWFKWWGYYPVDAEELTTAQSFIINQMDMPITYSKTGLNATINSTKREDTRLIFHGVNTDLFVPNKDKNVLKSKYRMSNKFIVGTVARNTARKNLPLLLESFGEFAKDKDDVILYLHTKPVDVGHNLYEFIKKYDIANKVVITKDLHPSKGVENDQLVDIYNLFDIFVSTTTGEGLLMPSLEAQLCEVPVLVTDFSACKEFVSKEMRLNTSASYYEPFWDVERRIVDKKDLIQKLNLYYQNRNILPSIGKQCRQYCLGWDWKYIEPLWKYLVMEFKDSLKPNLTGFNKI